LIGTVYINAGIKMSSKNIRRVIVKGSWAVRVIAALFCVSTVAEAATLKVGTCRGAGFATIQSAVNAANPGDNINVCPGSYPEQVLIDKSLTDASGDIRNNDVIDHISVGTGFAASGIIIFGSSNVQVRGNTIGNNQFGVAVATTKTAKADNTIITQNTIFGTQEIDGIDLCSNGNVVTHNTIASSDESAVNLDSSCGTTGNGNTVTHNIINEACAGILAGSGTTGNTTTPNNFFNVSNINLSGDQCPAQVAGASPARPQSAFGRLALAPSVRRTDLSCRKPTSSSRSSEAVLAKRET
jgi:hypothetical protein